MLTFIIPVKHFDNCFSYKNTWKILEDTLRSISGQTDDRFNVIVVSNKTLNNFSNKNQIRNTQFIELNWPPAAQKNKWQLRTQIPRHQGISAVRRDKGLKYIVGITEAIKKLTEQDHIMLMDADDFIHKDLTKRVIELNKDLISINKGYMLGKEDSYKILNDFSQHCGSCNIGRVSMLTSQFKNKALSEHPSEKEASLCCEKPYRDEILGSHKIFFSFFKERGYASYLINTPAAIYNCSHREQNFGRKKRKFKKKITKKMKLDFCLK
jgi:hypothetical protein